jgi:hypothetical protein
MGVGRWDIFATAYTPHCLETPKTGMSWPENEPRLHKGTKTEKNSNSNPKEHNLNMTRKF